MENNLRPSLDAYYMGLAHAAKARATCQHKQVGAVVVLNNQVLATGYNGSLPGAQECDQVNCQILRAKQSGEVAKNCNTIHAEVNAIFQCLNREVSVKGATLYVTFAPCVDCCKVCALSGIARVVYDEPNSFCQTHMHFANSLEISQIK